MGCETRQKVLMALRDRGCRGSVQALLQANSFLVCMPGKFESRSLLVSQPKSFIQLLQPAKLSYCLVTRCAYVADELPFQLCRWL